MKEKVEYYYQENSTLILAELPKRGLSVIEFGLPLGVGRAGISSILLERIQRNVTPASKEFHQRVQLEQNGVELSVTSRWNYLNYTLTMLPELLPAVLDTLPNLLTISSFEDVQVSRHIGELQAEYQELHNNNAELVRLITACQLGEARFATNPLGLISSHELATITPAAIQAAIRQGITANTARLVVAGPFEIKEMLPRTRKMLLNLPQTTPLIERELTRVSQNSANWLDKAEVTVQLAIANQVKPGIYSSEWAEIYALTFEDLLMAELRHEKGLAYAINSLAYGPYFSIFIELDVETISSSWQKIEKIISSRPTNLAVQTATLRAITQNILALESTREIAHRLFDAFQLTTPSIISRPTVLHSLMQHESPSLLGSWNIMAIGPAGSCSVLPDHAALLKLGV